MNCVILQPSYIPWRGYFHQIQRADVFVFYDDVQYDKHGWRNRNRIKTAQGSQWLTIPVLKKGNVEASREIREIEIAWDRPWNRKHLTAIMQSYRKAPCFDWLCPSLQKWYSRTPAMLADFTIAFTIELADCLGLRGTRFVRSSELKIPGYRTDRLIDIVKAVGCNHYITGPAARGYLEEDKFSDAGVTLEYMEYNYPEYPQLYPLFDPHVSILDLLMMTGGDAPRYIWAS
jgi:hypothetical protein